MKQLHINHGRPLKRLLDTWDRNVPTSGPTAWQIYDDDDDDDEIYIKNVQSLLLHVLVVNRHFQVQQLRHV